MTYGLSQGDGLIVITGDVGSGKTTLIDHLLAQLDPNECVVAPIVTSQLPPNGLVRVILAAFEVRFGAGEKTAIFGRFDEFDQQKQSAGIRILIIIDEVQNLPFATLEELRLLSNLATGDRAPPQTSLMGQAQFLDIRSMKVEQLCQPIFTSDHLGVLEESEVGPYARHGLRLAEWSDDPSFDDGVFPAIYANETHRIFYADVCEVAKEWLSEPGALPAPSSPPVGKRTPKIERRLNVIDRTPPRRESPLNRLVTDFER